MRSALRTAALALSASLAFALPATAEVQLSLRDGRVTLVARDATIRQILAEWARVGKTKIINAERIPGGPLTLELKNVPEAEALDVLLRTLSGYIAAPRTALAPDASVFDTIAVMPTIASAAPRTSVASGAPAPFSPPPAFNQTGDDDQDNPQARPGGPQGARPPIFSTFPTPQQGNPNQNSARPVLPVVRPGVVGQPPVQQPNINNNVNEAPGPIAPPQLPPSTPTTAPGGLTGVSAPGMMPPAASQPGQVQPPPR